MIYLKLTLAHICTFLGRNDYGKQSGLQVSTFRHVSTPGHQVVEIAPITSKGQEARCFVQFPVQDIPAIIEALQKIQADTAAN